MTVLSSKLHWNGTTGSLKRDSVEYTAVYFVTTDDKNDQARTVLLWFEANVIRRGDFYAYAGDTTGIARAKSIRAKRSREHLLYWEVTVNYATESDEDGKDEDGNPTDNPPDFRPEISVRTVQYERALMKAEYLEGFTGYVAARIQPGHIMTPRASNAIAFDPPMTRDDARQVLTITRNLVTYNGSNDVILAKSMNSEPFKLDKYGYRIDHVDRWMARIRDISMTMERQNNVDFLKVTYVVDLDPETWLHQEVDRGTHGLIYRGAPDGSGGLYGLPGGKSIPNDKKYRKFIDDEGNPYTNAVNMDGAGQELQDPITEPVILKFKGYEEIDYLNNTFLSAVLEPP